MRLPLAAIILLITPATATSNTHTHHSTRLRSHLLNESYQKIVVPISNRPDGTLVEIGLRIFKVQHVDTSSGSLRLKVWLRLRWTDLRLAWDPADFGNVTQTHMRAAAITNDQDTDIWLPDVQPYNAGEAISSTLEPSIALVSSDGSVYWSRPGTLDVLCKYRGLNSFPFHNWLGCPIDFGGWMISGTYQGIELLDGGSELYDSEAGSEESAGSSYSEWSVGNMTAKVEPRIYPCCPNEPWPVVSYHITLSRASGTRWFYIMHLIVPSIIFATLALLACFLSPDSGERIGLCVTLLLAREFGKALMFDHLPICDEVLWINCFDLLNELFTCVPLIETLVVIFFYYRDSDFFSSTAKRLHARLRPAHNTAQMFSEDERESASARLLRQALDPPSPAEAPAAAEAIREAIREAAEEAPAAEAPAAEAPAAEDAGGLGGAGVSGWDVISAAPRRLAAGDGFSAKEYSRLIFLERLFFTLDLTDGREQCVRFEQVDRFLSFVAFDLTPSERARLIIHGQQNRLENLSDLASGEFYREQLSQISRAEFVRICFDALGDKTDKEIETAAATFVSAQKLRRKATLQRMQRFAVLIDVYFRMIALPTYGLTLMSFFLVIEEKDDPNNIYFPKDGVYHTNGTSASIEAQAGGLVLTITLVILILTLSRLYIYAGHRLVRTEQDEQSQRLVELLAAQQHGPAMRRLLERMQAMDEPAGLFGSSKALVQPEEATPRRQSQTKRKKQTNKPPVWR